MFFSAVARLGFYQTKYIVIIGMDKTRSKYTVSIAYLLEKQDYSPKNNTKKKKKDDPDQSVGFFCLFLTIPALAS